MATGTTVDFDTGHTGPINDIKFDSLGRLVATASSDCTVKIFQLNSDGKEEPTLNQTLTGHTGPVWQVAWAPPSFGHFLASASYDRTVRIWHINETSYSVPTHTASVSAVAWAPAQVGMVLASGSLDGSVALTRWSSAHNGWQSTTVSHGAPVLSVAWRPPLEEPDTATPTKPSAGAQALLASGGCDGRVVLWAQGIDAGAPTLVQVAAVRLQRGWVRALAFPQTSWGGALAAGTGDGAVLFLVDDAADHEPAALPPVAVAQVDESDPFSSVADPFRDVGGAFGGVGDADAAAVTEATGGWTVVHSVDVGACVHRIAYDAAGVSVSVAVADAAEVKTITPDI